ncbi:mannose-1-phosphate guanylyltransferase [Thermoanaerobacterium thermosaccharolyticum]|uniref:Mannose-1-phosphate guanylyltransferase n=1 Tax=Thermoanaerobacterium thermosaccharolyticum TaxID=1517 RepID=A0A223I1E8_THETR|nr:hypothetical protein [Thermoanaerobacterium thermosaccharolyticum]AST58551.1 mannose-1-phosphate guanylyltransferase [Thermoanaerobacterium thermosaccharolyticum]
MRFSFITRKYVGKACGQNITACIGLNAKRLDENSLMVVVLSDDTITDKDPNIKKCDRKSNYK